MNRWHPMEEVEGGWTGRSGLTYIHYHVWNSQLVGSSAQKAQLGALSRLRAGSREGGGQGQGGEDVCIRMADSCWCTAETNTTLLSNYMPVKTTKHINAVMSFISLSGLHAQLKESMIITCDLSLLSWLQFDHSWTFLKSSKYQII